MAGNKLVIICGPTGVGKTAVAVSVAQRFGGQIVGADSMQIYRMMDIGTAKPTEAEKRAVAHHLIDVCNPEDSFDAAAYAEAARKVVDRLAGKGIPALVVGGTGLYIKALTQGIFNGGESDPQIRSKLKRFADVNGLDALYRKLADLDPMTAKRVHPNDRLRIVRALEVRLTTGKPISEHHINHRFSHRPYRTLKIGLFMEREALYERIDKRVSRMIEAGFIEEVRNLLEMGYAPELKSMQSIGYRHMIEYLNGACSLEAAIDTMKRDSRRYAKRQMTWFRADPEIVWKTPEASVEIERLVGDFLGT